MATALRYQTDFRSVHHHGWSNQTDGNNAGKRTYTQETGKVGTCAELLIAGKCYG